MLVVDNVNLPDDGPKLPDSETTPDASAARTKASLTVLTLAELLDRRETPKRALLGSWLRQGEAALLYGPTGCGKSLLALSMALAVAGGGKLLGWQGMAASRVLYVDGELDVGDIRERVAMLLEALPGVDRKLALDAVSLFARMDLSNQGEFLSITSNKGRKELLDLVDMGKVDLVILDNLATLGDIEDENSAGAFNALVKTLLALKRKGVAVILVHHADKTGKKYRGSSKLPAVMDVVLGLDTNGHKLIGEARFTLSWEKSRAIGKDLKPSVVRLVYDADNGNNAQWLVDAGSDRLDQIKTMLASSEYSTQIELAKVFGCSVRMIGKYFDNGAIQGLWYEGWPQACLDAVKRGKRVPLATAMKRLTVVNDGQDDDPSDF